MKNVMNETHLRYLAIRICTFIPPLVTLAQQPHFDTVREAIPQPETQSKGGSQDSEAAARVPFLAEIASTATAYLVCERHAVAGAVTGLVRLAVERENQRHGVLAHVGGPPVSPGWPQVQRYPLRFHSPRTWL